MIISILTRNKQEYTQGFMAGLKRPAKENISYVTFRYGKTTGIFFSAGKNLKDKKVPFSLYFILNIYTFVHIHYQVTSFLF